MLASGKHTPRPPGRLLTFCARGRALRRTAAHRRCHASLAWWKLEPAGASRCSRHDGSLLASGAVGTSSVAGAVAACGGLAASTSESGSHATARDASDERDSASRDASSVRLPPPPDSAAGNVYDASCLNIVLDPDAAPHTCHLTPADVACDSSADCVLWLVPGCGCAPRSSA
jgi:hypothetical protein